ncbi:MAG: glycosyltransferase [Bacteroidota bacterium]|nr:glycosyltransferase [Bacteroidota bacterium]
MAYKDSPYLRACIDSLKKQTIKSEIFITTSTPTDNIHAIADDYNLQLHITIGGQGIAHDWNFALQSASTRYVTLAHQDDLYLPDYTASCLKAANSRKDTLICFTDYEEIADNFLRSNNRLLRTKRLMIRTFLPLRHHLTTRFWKTRLLSFGCPIAAPTVMFDLKQIRDFNFSPAYTVSIDWEGWYRLAQMKGSFIYVPQILLQHRIHSASETTNAIGGSRRQAEDQLMYRKFWPPVIVKLLSRLYAEGYKSNQL